MKIQKCKGCRDLLPVDMARFRRVEQAFLEACRRSGYREVRTPTLEYLYLFTSAGTLTPGMLRRVYSFLDWDGWSGERVVLKPDATIPVARLYLDQLSSQPPARLGYTTNTFIFEETGLKPRERWQCGAELIGAGGSLADADLVALALEVLQHLAVYGVTLKLSHAGLIRAALSGLGISPEEQHDLFDRILDGGVEAIDAVNTGSPQRVETIRLMFGTRGESSGYLKNIKALAAADSPAFRAALDDFIRSFELIEGLGVPCRIDMTAGKGFEYYTGLIFRIDAGEDNVGGGGRYDHLISVLGGPDTPAAGFALYMDRLMALLPDVAGTARHVSVICWPETFKEAHGIATALRASGMTAELALSVPPVAGWRIEVTPGGIFVTDSSGKRDAYINVEQIEKRLEQA